MTDEPLDDEVPEGPRRKTFEPLSDDVVFTGAIPVVDGVPDDAPADEPASIPDPQFGHRSRSPQFWRNSVTRMRAVLRT